MRELNSKLVITEHGRRKVITKYEGMAKQLVNKALSGSLMAARVLIPYYKEELAKITEQRLKSPRTNPNLIPRDMSTEELMAFIEEEAEKRIRPGLEKSIRASLQRSIRIELENTMRAKLEKSIRAEVERSIGREANGRGKIKGNSVTQGTSGALQ